MQHKPKYERVFSRYPKTLAIRCPNCSGHARFSFAEARTIERREDLPVFQTSSDFECIYIYDGGTFCNAAAFYPGLTRTSLPPDETLPERYHLGRSDKWGSCFALNSRPQGTLVCLGCDLRRKHSLDWPVDAYFQIEHKGSVLWAYDRGTATELLEFINSDGREAAKFEHGRFLRRIPTLFLQASNRSAVTKKLKSAIGEN